MRWWLSRPTLLRALYSHARLAVRLLREPRVSWLSRAVPAMAVGYVISPLDFVPDMLPLLGQVDDLGIIALGLQLFVASCPSAAVAFHRAAIAARHPYSPMPPTADVIDAEFRHES